jgi:hypothetical protein
MERSESRSSGRGARDRRAALALAGCVVALACLASVARWFGATEAVAGGALAVACPALLAGFITLRLRDSGRRAATFLPWTLALVVAAAAPMLHSMFPGRLLAEGSLSQKGDAVPLPSGLHGAVRVLASADLPEGSLLHFSIQAGPVASSADLRRQARWWRAGDERRHYHEDRRSVLFTVDVARGVDELVLAGVSGRADQLRVRVFQTALPPWTVRVASLLLGLAFAARYSRSPRTRFAAGLGLVTVLGGVIGATEARPDAAVGAVLAGFAGGTVVGVPLAAAVAWVARRGGAIA